MRLALFVASCLSLLASQPAVADWAVAQSNHDKPFVQRYRSVEMASDVVMDACRAAYQSCKVVITGGSGCVALATTGSQWGVAKAGTQSRAAAAALDICNNLNAGACRIEEQFCGQ